ncbi:apyrase isoform X1 [Drosophila biarmipes]|uniref:apyrase isoform X1 n=1 Tax=Drosophila biarmipes TaxID=125945 RepID=UPI001CDAA665|nr:apyrase isoform X1 [Drosophila biarmipes]XP_050746360.1 apyrase isoform X1 [Drosophila biarmipes]
MTSSGIRFVCFVAMMVLLVAPLEAAKEGFPVSIIHINDLHARFEATDTSGGTCDEGEECIGGYPRTVYTVRRLLREQADLNPIYINAGDSFQGTLWYNIGRWNVTQQLLNILPAEAMTLGNHEFDHGVEGLVPFLETVETNMLVANMDCAHEPTMEGKYNKSMIIERSGRKIGLIGVILETTYDLANTGKVIFRNESDTIREEAQLLKAQGANIIIVISHCGYDVDQEIAANAGDWIDVIVGSHSHTFLYTGDPPGPHTPSGDYPTEVVHSSGHRVLIVQASAYARYVGNLVVYFDDNGDVLDFEGDPLYMDQSVPEDDIVLQAMVPWQSEMESYANQIVGQSRVYLQQYECSRGECNLGNFFTDAMLHAFLKDAPSTSLEDSWSNVTIALTSQGTFRVPIPAGNITYKQLFAMCPWQNRLVALTLQGKHIVELLEHVVAPMNSSSSSPRSSRFLQVSGLRFTIDLNAPAGRRVSSVRARCSKCQVPEYTALGLEEKYRVVVMEYLANGKNGFAVISDNAEDLEMGTFDLDALMDYMAAVGPIITGIEQRIKLVKT